MDDLPQFDTVAVRDFWVEEARESLLVADHLVEKEDYSYALFFGHLAVEKILKALYAVRHQEHPPFGHNLVRLARLVGLEVDESQADNLDLISSFNIEARYPDEKRSFRQKCTPEYTGRQMALIRETYQWLHSELT